MRWRLAFGLSVVTVVVGSAVACGGPQTTTNWVPFFTVPNGMPCKRSPDYDGSLEMHYGSEVCASKICEKTTCVAACSSGPGTENPKTGCQRQ